MQLLQCKAMVRVKRSTLGNAYLRPFSNYDEVQLVSIAFLVGPEPCVTLGADNKKNKAYL